MAGPNTYDVGSLVRVSVTFLDASGAVTDPSTVILKFRPGNSTTVTTWTFGGAGSIVKDSTGKYHADLDTTSAPGDWKYRYYSTGTAQTAKDATFIVKASPIG